MSDPSADTGSGSALTSDVEVEILREAIAREPAASLWEALGTILFTRGALAESRECYENALALDPRFPQALNNLAVAHQLAGELRAAEMRYREMLECDPENLGARLNFAALLAERGGHREGLEIVRRVLDRRPDLVRAYLVASELERESGRPAAALARVEQALAIAPERIDILIRRAHLLCAVGRWDEALKDCARVLRALPSDAEALRAKALALQGLNRPAAALAAFRAAEAVAAAPAPVIAARAWLLAELGLKRPALAALDQALALQPTLAAAWYYRTQLSQSVANDPALAIMEGLVDDPEAPHCSKVSLSFALGKAYLDLGDGERAFARLADGNRMQRAILDYDPDQEARRFAEIAAVFTVDLLSRNSGSGHASNRPIFVFGMPRSGTTLVEQILASHPLVHGAGEPVHLREIAEAAGFPHRVPELKPEDLAAMGRRYLDRVGAGVRDGSRIVDKLPLNFRHVGLISLMLPGARMIHCRRDPLDTCLACYSLLFTNGQEFSYDLGELGRYYGLYRELMAHWRGLLPPQSFFEIDYETLVSDPEGQIPMLLDYCGLPFDRACLRFYETPRRVNSASLDEVRSPAYTTSIGRAQRYRHWLGPLEAALSEASARGVGAQTSGLPRTAPGRSSGGGRSNPNNTVARLTMSA